MKRILLTSISALMLLTVVATWSCASKPTAGLSGWGVPAAAQTICGEGIDPRNLIEKLSSGGSEASQAAKVLLERSNASQGCRKQVIDALIQAMDKPHLRFVSDRRSYLLWLNGSAILGDLKAVEALDLLIDHLDLADGSFSASMIHQPAVLGVKAMGVLAVPKLGIALRQHASRNVRLAAALCLADIGGEEAVSVLTQALGTESDQCIRRFITLSVTTSDDETKSKPKVGTVDDADLLGQRLVAFRCDN
jgi:hypothetical protein